MKKSPLYFKSGGTPGSGSPIKIASAITQALTKYPRVAKAAQALGWGSYIGADVIAPEGSKTRKVLDFIDRVDNPVFSKYSDLASNIQKFAQYNVDRITQKREYDVKQKEKWKY